MCWNFAHLSNLPLSTKGCSGFFILFRSWVIDKPVFGKCVETKPLVSLYFANNLELKFLDKIPGFSKTIEPCLNFCVGFCVTYKYYQIIKKSVHVSQFYINHLSSTWPLNYLELWSWHKLFSPISLSSVEWSLKILRTVEWGIENSRT